MPQVIQPIVDKMAEKYKCAVSVALVKDDATKGFKAAVAGGVIDVAPGDDTPGTPTKVSDDFVWGSVTKVLTGSSILRLVTNGVIKLDDYAAQYIDPFMKAMKEMNGDRCSNILDAVMPFPPSPRAHVAPIHVSSQPFPYAFEITCILR